MFHKLKPFTDRNVKAVPRGPGIYIIYADGEPFYIGRSTRDIHERLWKHFTRTGSRKVAEAVSQGIALEFEYQEMLSVEQAEAQLIHAFGTYKFGNLRRETDPVDW